MDGESLIKALASATGLPQTWVEEELKTLIVKQGLEPKDVSLAQLRVILAEFLQDTLLSAKESLPAAK